jgi:hypothetical protein
MVKERLESFSSKIQAKTVETKYHCFAFQREPERARAAGERGVAERPAFDRSKSAGFHSFMIRVSARVDASDRNVDAWLPRGFFSGIVWFSSVNFGIVQCQPPYLGRSGSPKVKKSIMLLTRNFKRPSRRP